jgi:hypothetical protein
MACALLALAQGPQDAKPSIPTQEGMFYRTSAGYTRLERINPTGSKSSGVAKAGFTYGIAKAGVDVTYSGPGAQLQLEERRPVFVYVSTAETSTQQIILVRFRQKKDHRESMTCKVGLWSGVNCSVETKTRVDLDVRRDPANNIVIQPKAALTAGEYLLMTGPPAGWNERSGYDFGVRGIR